jgi:transcriptional antiterminator NusG
MSDAMTDHVEPEVEVRAEPPTAETPAPEGAAPEGAAPVDAPAAETPTDQTSTVVQEGEATAAEPAQTEVTEAEITGTVDAETAAAEAADADASEDDAEGEAEPAEPSPWLRPGQWFVVHTQSGYEKKVKSNLEARIQSMNMEEKIFEVVIPMEDVVEFKGGRKQVVQRKVFPGYLLVRCEMDDASWYVIRNTPGVTGFVGQGRFGQKPTPLSRREVDTFLSAKGDGAEAPRHSKPKLEYDVGESVRVKEGPFADFTGSVAEINVDHLKLKVLVNIFGRETLVEMDFSQVAKI